MQASAPASAQPKMTTAELEAVIDSMSFRERLNLMLAAGVPAEYIMGIETCTDHRYGGKLAVNAPLAFDGSVMWCKGCWSWVRM